MIGDRWGATEAEVARTYPCDTWVDGPAAQCWRAVTISASPEVVWSWLIQVRQAPYSYDWIDNLGRRSPQLPLQLPDPHPGERFTTAAAFVPLGTVLAVKPYKELTAEIAGVLMSYVLEPAEDGQTRLLLKIAKARWTGVLAPLSDLVAPVLSLGDLIMARRQLLNFKRLAEHAMRNADTTSMGVHR